VREEGGVGCDVFGECALLFSDTADHAENFVAGSEGGDSGADGFHGACHVEAEDGGEWLVGVAALSGADLGVEWVDARGVNFHEHLMMRGSGCGEFYFDEGAIGSLDLESFHGLSVRSVMKKEVGQLREVLMHCVGTRAKFFCGCVGPVSPVGWIAE
jgi:hypothetical protein